MKSFNPNLPACVTNSSNLAQLSKENRELSFRFLQALENKLVCEATASSAHGSRFARMVAQGTQVKFVRGML